MNARLAHLRNGTALIVGALVQAVVGFGTQIVLMRLLLPQDYGQFAIVLAGCSLVQTILSLRLNVMIIRLPVDDRTSPRARLYQAALVWETVLAGLVSLVWLTAAGLTSAPALIVLAALTIGQWINQVVAFYERGMDYRRITLVETGSQIAGHATALALALAGLGPVCLYLRELAAIVAKLTAFAAIGALPAPAFSRPTSEQLRQLWREVRGIWLEGILEGMFARLIILASGIVGGHHGAGLFAQSYRLALLPHQFLAPVVSRLSVNLFNRTDDRRQRQRWLARLCLGTIVVILPGLGITWVWAADVVPWLFGPNWAEAGDLVKAMIGIMLFFPLFDLLRSFSFAHGRTVPVLAGRVSQILVFVLPALLLDPDILGLSWALSAACAAGCLAMAVPILVALKARPSGA